MPVSHAAVPEVLPNAPGTYALLLELPRATRLSIGRLGTFSLARGFYLYLGSAHGPGGLRARVLRHWRSTKREHWHIDYLRRIAVPVRVWYSTDPRADECRWARVLLGAPNTSVPVPRFGASDCTCAAHLVAVPGARYVQALFAEPDMYLHGFPL
jgi:Uri superfamily endonuclease